MKRFVDLRSAEIAGYRFAWWDTVVDGFEIHGGNQAWEFWEDFEEDYGGIYLDRYLELAPDWVLTVERPPD